MASHCLLEAFRTPPSFDEIRACIRKLLNCDTLVLRLLGRGATFTRAARDLGALSRDAPERRLVAPFLVSLRTKLVKVQAKDRLTEEEKELLVNGQKLIDAIETKGWKRGQKAGLEPLVHQFTRRLGRPLTQSERTSIVRRLDTLGPSRLGDVVLDLDTAGLATWLADPDAR